MEYNNENINENIDINDYFTDYRIIKPIDYVGATFSTMNYSEYNVNKYDEENEPIKKNVIQLKYENMREKQEERDRMESIINRLHNEKIRLMIRRRDDEREQRKREREEQIKNHRFYYLYRLYDVFFINL